MTSKNVQIEKYSEKSFVVRGETKEHKTQLSELGGKWNSRLKGGAGWIFPNNLRENVENWIKNDIVVRNKKYENIYSFWITLPPIVTNGVYFSNNSKNSPILDQF